MERASRGPTIWGVCFGFSWIALSLILMGMMVSGYSQIWGMKGIAFALMVLPLSAPAFPFLNWYLAGDFPWLWVGGLILAVLMGSIALTD